MRVLVLGGTGFVGRHVVERLAARGDEVLVAHRGREEPAADDGSQAHHLHCDRREFARVAADVRAFGPDVVVDSCARTRADVEAVHPHLPDGAHLVELSSQDVYRAYELLLAGAEGEPVPLTEASPVRRLRYPYRGRVTSRPRRPDTDDYDKLDVEPATLARGGTVLRLGMVYGEHDGQRREEPLLRRVRAGRRRIPVGTGTWLWTKVYAGDVAAAVAAVVDTPGAAAGQVFNLGESTTRSMLGWVREVLAAAGSDAEPVPVPDDGVPTDLWFTRSIQQHLLTDARHAADVLGWRHSDVPTAVGRSVAWHLAHPPDDPDPDFAADDAALAALPGG